MTTSRQAYVWIWMPGQTEPVVAGVLTLSGSKYSFAYGRSYLERPDALSIYEPELPLKRGEQLPDADIAGSLRDAAPDAWGRRVILQSLLGRRSQSVDLAGLDELTYLLESGSDRIGALDFQLSPTEYMPRQNESVALAELQSVADRIMRGEALPGPLATAIQHGTSIGGARPKVLIEDGSRKCIAKFSTSADHYNIVKSEYVAMRLASLAGLNVARVNLKRVAERDVLIVERFDREASGSRWFRKPMVSALTVLGLDEMAARYASYEDLAEQVRLRFTRPKDTLIELYRRLVFNVIIGNTDDHARNHAAFWDGKELTLTPGYDICPQLRTGREASQGMLISGTNRLSRISSCLNAASGFRIEKNRAIHFIRELIDAVQENWPQTVSEAALSDTEEKLLWRHQILNPGIFDGLDDNTRRVFA